MSDAAKFREAIKELNKARQERGLELNGKLYSMVKDRVEVFRNTWGDEYGIDTQVDFDRGFNTGEVIVCIAKITTREGIVMASGTAMDRIGHDQVSTTAPIEACETAAIGRALAAFGLGGGEYASDVEIAAIPRKTQAANGTKPQAGGATGDHYPGFDNLNLNRQVTGHLVPNSDDNQTWNDPHPLADTVISTVKSISDRDELASYWYELLSFRGVLGKQVPERLSELKAVFHNQFDLSKQEARNGVSEQTTR